jgi:hypothetical protein
MNCSDLNTPHPNIKYVIKAYTAILKTQGCFLKIIRSLCLDCSSCTASKGQIKANAFNHNKMLVPFK